MCVREKTYFRKNRVYGVINHDPSDSQKRFYKKKKENTKKKIRLVYIRRRLFCSAE